MNTTHDYFKFQDDMMRQLDRQVAEAGRAAARPSVPPGTPLGAIELVDLALSSQFVQLSESLARLGAADVATDFAAAPNWRAKTRGAAAAPSRASEVIDVQAREVEKPDKT